MATILVKLLLIFLSPFLIGTKAQSTYTSAATDIMTALLISYDSRIRPDSEVAVEVSLSLTSVNYLDMESGLFSVVAQFTMFWYDSSFRWTPGTSNVESLFLTNTDCWRPEVSIDNEANNIDMFSDRYQRMRVTYHGVVLWETSGEIIVPCDIDVSSDTQKCSIRLYSMYASNEVALHPHVDKVHINVPTHPEWNILDTSISAENKTDPLGANRTYLSFQFELEQKHNWFSIIVYLLISSLGSIVFLLPVDKGERISFACVIILTDTIIFLYIRMYETYLTVGTFLLLLLISNILQLLMALFVLRIYHNDQTEKPVSSGIQTFTRTVLVRMSCSCCRQPNVEDEENDKVTSSLKTMTSKKSRVSPSNVSGWQTRNEFDRIKSAASTRTTADIFTRTSSADESTSSSSVLIKYEYSWMEIAGMLDRIFLMISLIMFVCLTIVFILILYI
ncbi:extracellular ligand-gated ion channel [Mactra antiquata]